MWRDGLHPDISTWDEIVAKAEMIEVADNVIDRQGAGPMACKGWQSDMTYGKLRAGQNLASELESVSYTHQDRNDRRSLQDGKVNNPSDEKRHQGGGSMS